MYKFKLGCGTTKVTRNINTAFDEGSEVSRLRRISFKSFCLEIQTSTTYLDIHSYLQPGLKEVLPKLIETTPSKTDGRSANTGTIITRTRKASV